MTRLVFNPLIAIFLVSCGETMFEEGVPTTQKAKFEPDTKSEDSENTEVLESQDGQEDADAEELASEPEQDIPKEQEQQDLAEEKSENIPVEQADKALSCFEAISAKNTNLANVVHISSQREEELLLTPDTFIVLDLSGQANIELNSEEIEKINGLCINSTGDANALIEIEFAVDEMNYYGRGNATTSLVFSDSGTFDKIKLDIAGAHGIDISGKSIDCSLLDTNRNGSGKVNCDNYSEFE